MHFQFCQCPPWSSKISVSQWRDGSSATTARCVTRRPTKPPAATSIHSTPPLSGSISTTAVPPRRFRVACCCSASLMSVHYSRPLQYCQKTSSAETADPVHRTYTDARFDPFGGDAFRPCSRTTIVRRGSYELREPIFTAQTCQTGPRIDLGCWPRFPGCFWSRKSYFNTTSRFVDSFDN